MYTDIKIERLETDLIRAQRERAKAQDEAKAQEDRAMRWRKSCEAAEKNAAQQKQDKETLYKELSESCAALKLQLHTAQEEQRGLRATLDAKIQEKLYVQRERDDALQDAVQVRKQLETSALERDQARLASKNPQTVKDQEERIASLEKDLHWSRARVSEYGKKNAELYDKWTKRGTENYRNAERIEVLEAELKQYKEWLVSERTELAKYKAAGSMRGLDPLTVKGIQDANRSLNNQAGELAVTIKDYQRTIKALTADTKDLEKANASLCEDLRIQKAEVQRLNVAALDCPPCKELAALKEANRMLAEDLHKLANESPKASKALGIIGPGSGLPPGEYVCVTKSDFEKLEANQIDWWTADEQTAKYAGEKSKRLALGKTNTKLAQRNQSLERQLKDKQNLAQKLHNSEQATKAVAQTLENQKKVVNTLAGRVDKGLQLIRGCENRGMNYYDFQLLSDMQKALTS